VSDIIADGSPLFLTVGSLEPRKNIGFVLDAFDVIWSRNSDVKLVLVGHRTWKVDDLISRIERHPQHGKRLFWLRDATDNDLGFLYQQAHALVFASCVEGFGLPLVEAMQRGLPVLCSDIPVFREIADGKVRFFSLAAEDELVAAVLDTAREQADPGRAERGTFRWMNWQESTEQLLNKVLAEHSLRHKANAPNCPASSAKRTSSQHRS
jgi:alpha-1,2-rhamnosyltransferase